MSSEFALRQGAGQKLEFAIQRNGGDATDVEWLSAGDHFFQVMKLARGQAKIVDLDLLLPRPPIMLETIDSPVDYAAFFQTRPGLWVDPDFIRWVVAEAKSVARMDAVTLPAFDLGQNGADKQIEDAMPPNHLFDAIDACRAIKQMIERQPAGEVGDLENTGRANLMYLEGCVVNVYWRVDERKWHVDVYRRFGYVWNADDRCLSRN